MKKYRIPKALFEPACPAVYIAGNVRKPGWFKFGITTRASVAYRACLATRSNTESSLGTREILRGIWIPRRLTLVNFDKPEKDLPQLLRDVENRTRHNLKDYIRKHNSLRLSDTWVSQDYFRLPLTTIWMQLADSLDHFQLRMKSTIDFTLV
jgi:hypothetical protein